MVSEKPDYSGPYLHFFLAKKVEVGRPRNHEPAIKPDKIWSWGPYPNFCLWADSINMCGYWTLSDFSQGGDPHPTLSQPSQNCLPSQSRRLSRINYKWLTHKYILLRRYQVYFYDNKPGPLLPKPREIVEEVQNVVLDHLVSWDGCSFKHLLHILKLLLNPEEIAEEAILYSWTSWWELVWMFLHRLNWRKNSMPTSSCRSWDPSQSWGDC